MDATEGFAFVCGLICGCAGLIAWAAWVLKKMEKY